MSNQSKPDTEAIATPTETPKAKEKPRVNHGVPHPQADPLVAHLYALIKSNPADPTVALKWLSERPIDVVRVAILRSQTTPWSIAAEPLVDTLTDDQARAVLAVAIVGLWQGVNKGLAAQQQQAVRR